MDAKIFAGTRWVTRGSHVSSHWTVMSIGGDGETVGVTGPGPCRAYQYIPVEEFLRDWECIDRCTVCNAADVVTARIVRENGLRHRILRCEKHLAEDS